MLLVLLSLFSSLTFADQKELPLWEAGAGVLPFRANHYRGSPQSKNYFFPIPAYSVRSKNVEAENGYIRSHIYRFSRDLVLDLSFSLGLNVNSDQNELREGMESLDPTFEVGPILRYYLWKSQDENHFINLEMPYRAVYATDLTYLDHVGYYSIPYINLLNKGTPGTWGWGSEFSIGPQYGSTGFHNRFYAVDTKDVTARREYHHSAKGYSGTQFVATLSKRLNDILIIPFFRWDYLDGAVYNKSPLYKDPNYLFYGVSVVWFFAHSKEKQTAPTMVK
ncbi:MAG: MipA/OmpV family protein [Bdellovibrionales bacterium]|nr:MipA/OmpV family protein [Bdellovibrionales bacterium]